MTSTAESLGLSQAASHQRRDGVLFAIGCYGLWGFFPLYFRALKDFPAIEILLHRSLWSVPFLLVLVLASRGLPRIRQVLANPRARLTLLASATLLAGNWLLFIHAVEIGRVLEISLGYYINPLMSVALGVLVLGERLTRLQLLAIALATAGVVVLALQGGGFPWIALSLAASFAVYGLLRKTMALGSAEGLFAETSLMLPFMLGGLIWQLASGTSHFAQEGSVDTLLLLSTGVVTAVPLVFFGAAARRLKLSSMGMFQYMAPTIQFLTAVFLFGEHFTTAYAITFALIWLAVALFLFETWRKMRRAAP